MLAVTLTTCVGYVLQSRSLNWGYTYLPLITHTRPPYKFSFCIPVTIQMNFNLDDA